MSHRPPHWHDRSENIVMLPKASSRKSEDDNLREPKRKKGNPYRELRGNKDDMHSILLEPHRRAGITHWQQYCEAVSLSNDNRRSKYADSRNHDRR